MLNAVADVVADDGRRRRELALCVHVAGAFGADRLAAIVRARAGGGEDAVMRAMDNVLVANMGHPASVFAPLDGMVSTVGAMDGLLKLVVVDGVEALQALERADGVSSASALRGRLALLLRRLPLAGGGCFLVVHGSAAVEPLPLLSPAAVVTLSAPPLPLRFACPHCGRRTVCSARRQDDCVWSLCVSANGVVALDA